MEKARRIMIASSGVNDSAHAKLYTASMENCIGYIYMSLKIENLANQARPGSRQIGYQHRGKRSG